MAAKKTSSKVYYYGTGRRKDAVAAVRLVPGKGNITINGKSIDDYFGLDTLKLIVRQPLAATQTEDKFDVIVKAIGGGILQELLLKLMKRATRQFLRRADSSHVTHV